MNFINIREYNYIINFFRYEEYHVPEANDDNEPAMLPPPSYA